LWPWLEAIPIIELATLWRSGRSALRPAAFVAFLYLYVWLAVDPALAYHGYWLTLAFPVYRTTWEFAADRLAYPGGAAEYLGAFLSQLYRLSWLGALVICAVAGLLSLTTWGYLRALRGSAPRILHYAPALLFVVIYNRYRNPLAPALAALVAMACVWVYARAPMRGTARRLALFLGLGGLVYHAAGGTFLIFALLCGLFAAVAEGRWLVGAFCVGAGAAIPYLVGQFALALSPADAYLRFWAFHQDSDVRAFGLLLALYLSFPVLALGGAAWRLFGGRARLAPLAVRSWRGARFLASPLFGRLRWAAEAALPAVSAAVVLGLSFAGGTKALFQVEYHARRGNWDGVLQVARTMRPQEYSLFVNWDVNRALHHTGRLPQEMFSYPQNVLGLLPSAREFRARRLPRPVWMKLCDVLLELGRVNEAEHMAYEALEFLGDHPLILEQLVLIAAAKDELETARILLCMLASDPLRAKWARGYLQRLEADPSLSWDPEVQRLRSLMVSEDAVGWLDPVETLSQSLKRNKQNRMAFEYLMGYYLLTRNLEGVVQNIGRLESFGYHGIPRHYEEALVLYLSTRGASAAPYGWSIGEDVLRRYQEFAAVLARYRARPDVARDLLAPVYGNSYFFYYTFDESGVGR